MTADTTITDRELLKRFTAAGDDTAFETLVRRHLNLVYSTALRIVNGDTHLAEDVSQRVFGDLCAKAPSFSEGVILSGWLYEATRFAAAKAVRSEQRRAAREREAITMQTTGDEADRTWDDVALHLDGAMAELSAQERDAVVLRYFANKSLREVGAAFGASDDAAQKRVGRALEHLRDLLARRGVTIGAVALGAALSGNAVTAAPAGLENSLASVGAAGRGATVGNWATSKHVIATLLILVTTAVLVFQIAGRGFSGRKSPPKSFTALTDREVVGRYIWLEGGKPAFTIVLYPDHTFMNKDGTTLAGYRWDITPDALEVRWSSGVTRLTSIEKDGVFTGSTAKGEPIRIEKQPVEPPPRVLTQVVAPEAVVASVSAGREAILSRLTPANTGSDGRFEIGSVGDTDCFRLVRNPRRPAAYLYLRIDPDLKTPPLTNLWVVVDYFDAGEGASLLLQYDSSIEPYRSTDRVIIAGTERWRQAAFPLSEPLLENRQNDSADFRLCAIAPELMVRSVKLVRCVTPPH